MYRPSRAASSEIAGKIRTSMYQNMAVIMPGPISVLLQLDQLDV